MSTYTGTCKARLWSIPNALLVGHTTVEAIAAALGEAAAELLSFDAEAFKSTLIDFATIEPEDEPDAES